MHVGLDLPLCEVGKTASISQGCCESEMMSGHKPGLSSLLSKWGHLAKESVVRRWRGRNRVHLMDGAYKGRERECRRWRKITK